MPSHWLLLILASGLVFAVVIDARQRRIPNWLTGGLAVTGLAGAAILQGLSGAWQSVLGLTVGAVILLPFFVRRAMGAGDVKLLAAAGSFLGPGSALVAGGFSLMIGAIMALAIVAVQTVPALAALHPRTIREVSADSDATLGLRGQTFPYALAIALGVVAACWYQGLFAGTHGG